MHSRYKVYGFEWVNAPDGALIYFQNGIGYLLPIPADWDAQNAADNGYVLGIGAGLPRWRTGGLPAIEGVMMIESEPSGTSGALRDADCNVMYAFPE
jgi:hypothetical protein